MTYNKLLKKINKEIKSYDGVLQVCKEWIALRAVVELHKPFENYFKIMICSHCLNSKIAKEHFYPCPTIQAIEEGLK